LNTSFPAMSHSFLCGSHRTLQYQKADVNLNKGSKNNICSFLSIQSHIYFLSISAINLPLFASGGQTSGCTSPSMSWCKQPKAFKYVIIEKYC
jgi:hypothetical protein